MPRKDAIHDAVKNALGKAGWRVTHDPFRIEFGQMDVYADLRIEKPAGQDSDVAFKRALVIEIKSFSGPSPVHNLGVALGQYELYRTFLRQISPDEKVYLAVSKDIYEEHFVTEAFQLVVQEHHVAMVVVDVVQEEVVLWID